VPLTRPAEISNGVSLSDKLTGAVSLRGFVSEYSAVDALLSAVVDELPPNKHGVAVPGSQDNVLTGADELASLAAIPVTVGAIVPAIEGETRCIPVLRDEPERITQSPHLSSEGRSPEIRGPERNARHHLRP
jgi:hypothetical protein